MTRPESSETETAWTSGQAAARRKALTDAGMERPVAEVLVDLLDEQATPMMTRAEADARFAAMLDRLDAQRARDRAEMEARFAQVDARFAELKGELDVRFARVDARFGAIEGRLDSIEGRFEGRFGAIEGRFGSIEGQIAGLAGQLGTLKWTFGGIMAFNTLLLGVLTYTVAS